MKLTQTGRFILSEEFRKKEAVGRGAVGRAGPGKGGGGTWVGGTWGGAGPSATSAPRRAQIWRQAPTALFAAVA